MISKTKIRKRTERKRNSEVVETIALSNKNPQWDKMTKFLSGPRKKYNSVNLKEIDSKTSEGDTVVILGKVLGVGEITKKVRVCALGFSSSAIEKLKENKSEIVILKDEISKNHKAEGIKVLTGRKNE